MVEKASRSDGERFRLARKVPALGLFLPFSLLHAYTNSGLGFDKFAQDSETRGNPHLYHRKPQKDLYGIRADVHAIRNFFAGQTFQQKPTVWPSRGRSWYRVEALDIAILARSPRFKRRGKHEPFGPV